MNGRLDLVALVADADAEWTLRTLLAKRARALDIRPLEFSVIRHPDRDPGVCQRSAGLLRPYLRTVSFALVMLDRDGCGQETSSADTIEDSLEQQLTQNGWVDGRGKARAAAIVLDPELEVWVWSRSPHVAGILGLTPADLQSVLSNYESGPNGKPRRPKEAMLAALRRSGRPPSAHIFEELAETVSLRSQERAFDKLRRILQLWFHTDLIVHRRVR